MDLLQREAIYLWYYFSVQACVDLVYATPDGASLIKRMESRNGIHTLEHAGAIGVGSCEYELIRLDA